PSHPDLPRQAPASPNLSPVQVKREETPISLEELRQSHSLQRPLKRSPSPPWGRGWKGLPRPSPATLRRILGPARRQRSPPRLQSLSYASSTGFTAVAAARPLKHSFLEKFARRTVTTVASVRGQSFVPLVADNVVP
ncbi:hypothetical protein POSPLADRAFT_1110692, partial [Postia placenta MAD-698-R-SB12]